MLVEQAGQANIVLVNETINFSCRVWDEWQGGLIRSNLKASMSIFLMDLKENFFLGSCQAREITRSNVCPSVCVGPSACWIHPNDPISELNSSGTLLLFFLSKWILKSPTIIVFVVEEASRFRSAWSKLFHKPQAALYIPGISHGYPLILSLSLSRGIYPVYPKYILIIASKGYTF